MPINKLYHIWFQRILQMYPWLRLTQQRNLAWMIVGIYQSRCVQLHRIASKIPGTARLTSIVARLMRFADNHALHVRPLYEPIAREWLEFQARTAGRIQLVMDGTKIGSGHQLLMVAILFRRRAVPLVWTWMRCVKGHSSAGKQLALLAYARKLIPTEVPVVLVGDALDKYEEVFRVRLGRLATIAPRDKWPPDAQVLIKLAEEKINQGPVEPFYKVLPNYIRMPDAKEKSTREKSS